MTATNTAPNVRNTSFNSRYLLSSSTMIPNLIYESWRQIPAMETEPAADIPA